VTTAAARAYSGALHPIHATLLAGTVPLFLAAMLSDIAYSSSYEIQWSNFSSWLIAGGLVFGGLAFVCALIGLARPERRQGRALFYIILLLVTWILGFINALIHAKDAWAMMSTGLVLSVIVTLLACTATWAGLSMGYAGLGYAGDRK